VGYSGLEVWLLGVISMLVPVGGSEGACDTGWLGTAGAGRCGALCRPLVSPLEVPVSLGAPAAVRLAAPVLDEPALLEPVFEPAPALEPEFDVPLLDAPVLEEPSLVEPLLAPVVAPLGLAVVEPVVGAPVDEPVVDGVVVLPVLLPVVDGVVVLPVVLPVVDGVVVLPVVLPVVDGVPVVVPVVLGAWLADGLGVVGVVLVVLGVVFGVVLVLPLECVAGGALVVSPGVRSLVELVESVSDDFGHKKIAATMTTMATTPPTPISSVVCLRRSASA
jgi:hypothetical protein